MRGLYNPPDAGVFGQGGGSSELVEFVKAWAAVTLAFAVYIQDKHNVFAISFLTSLLIAGATVGVGMVVHELAHRVVARGYGAEAHFLSSPTAYLVLPIFLAFVGFFVAAPGAVWHRGSLTPAQLGHVALAGPVSNLILAALFFGAMYLLLPVAPLLVFPAYIGYTINAWLGLFNLIPVDPFDGAKILRWSPVALGVTAVVALFAVFVLPLVIDLPFF